MASLRPIFLIGLPVTLVACGGGSDGPTEPTGPVRTYVGADVTVPANNAQAREIGLDLDGDQVIDNQLGMVLGTLASQGFDVQGTVDEAVLLGSINLLLEFQSENLTSTNGAGLTVKLGDMPMPTPCPGGDESNPAACGLHLKGDGSFALAAGSPTDARVVGKIAGGVFTGGPGDITLQIALGTDPINLNLIGARAKATGLAEDTIGEVILAGALTEEDLNNEVIPAVHSQVADLVTRDCAGATPPDCTCTGSTGDTVLGLFDNNPQDCMVSIEEIKTNSLIQSLLAPDVTIDGVDALSLGIKVQAVGATIR